jgi:hypothetical protein
MQEEAAATVDRRNSNWRETVTFIREQNTLAFRKILKVYLLNM